MNRIMSKDLGLKKSAGGLLVYYSLLIAKRQRRSS